MDGDAWYCWWFRNPKQPPFGYINLVNTGMHYILTGAGFRPSTLAVAFVLLCCFLKGFTLVPVLSRFSFIYLGNECDVLTFLDDIFVHSFMGELRWTRIILMFGIFVTSILRKKKGQLGGLKHRVFWYLSTLERDVQTNQRSSQGKRLVGRERFMLGSLRLNKWNDDNPSYPQLPPRSLT